jgi:hypothetical protein
VRRLVAGGATAVLAFPLAVVVLGLAVPDPGPVGVAGSAVVAVALGVGAARLLPPDGPADPQDPGGG